MSLILIVERYSSVIWSDDPALWFNIFNLFEEISTPPNQHHYYYLQLRYIHSFDQYQFNLYSYKWNIFKIFMLEQTFLRKNSEKKNKMAELTTGSMLLNDKYQLTQLIGKGSFGQVYRGVLIESKEEAAKRYPKFTAIKVENDITKNSQIANEISILTSLNKIGKPVEGFPKLYASGIENGRAFMMMDLLGPNLQDLMILCGGKFSLGTALMLTIQIIQKIQMIHDLGYIYRDIKPENFVMGIGKYSHDVYLIDFGLCKKYRDSLTKLFVPYKESVSMVGTIRYSSLNSHLGIDQSRRDDIQSCIYLLIYFIRGQLPWQGLCAEHKYEKDHIIMDCKLKITPQELCKDLPIQIQYIFEYVKNLDFYQDPDYHYILAELSYVLQELNSSRLRYDWELFNKQNRIQKSNIQIILPNQDKSMRPSQSSENTIQSIDLSESLMSLNMRKNQSHRLSKFRDIKPDAIRN